MTLICGHFSGNFRYYTIPTVGLNQIAITRGAGEKRRKTTITKYLSTVVNFLKKTYTIYIYKVLQNVYIVFVLYLQNRAFPKWVVSIKSEMAIEWQLLKTLFIL